MRYLLYVPILLLFGCSSLVSDNSEKSKINLLGSHTIKFVGETSIENANLLEKIISNHPEAIDTLIIDSPGGDLIGGLNIGHLVNQYHLNVIVQNICASSCANYIVTASGNVTIEAGALLGWHGGATQPMYTSVDINMSWLDQVTRFFYGVDVDKSMDDYFNQLQHQEAIFFEKIGVEQAVTILGMMPGLQQQRDSMLFSFDQETLNRLGLSITFEDGKQVQLSKKGTKIVQIFTLPKEQLATLLTLHNELINKDQSSIIGAD